MGLWNQAELKFHLHLKPAVDTWVIHLTFIDRFHKM